MFPSVKKHLKNIETSVQRIMESQTICELWLNVAEVFPDQFNQMLQDNNIINLEQYLEGFGINLESFPLEIIDPDTLDIDGSDHTQDD